MKILKTLAFVGTLAIANSLMATPLSPISGGINFGGTSTINAGNYSSATAFNSFSDVVVDARSGDYLAVPSFYGAHAGETVTYNPFSFSATSVVPLWTFTVGTGPGAVTYSFDLTSLTIDSQTATGIHLVGSGIAKITGFADTVGTWDLSAGTENSFHFSSGNTATGRAVPDGGATAILLGVGICGLGALRRKVS